MILLSKKENSSLKMEINFIAPVMTKTRSEVMKTLLFAVSKHPGICPVLWTKGFTGQVMGDKNCSE